MGYDDGDLATKIGGFIILLLSIAWHESAHAYMADRLGDPNPRAQGRCTLNPIPHLHWLASVVLPAVMIYLNLPPIGAGRPVPVALDRLKNPSRDFMLIAIVGPLSNLLQAALWTGVFVALRRTEWLSYSDLAYRWFGFAIMANISLAVLNSLPIPPLDGSRFVGYLLPKTIQPWFYRLDPIGFIILLGLVLFHVIDPVMQATAGPMLSWWTDRYTAWLVGS